MNALYNTQIVDPNPIGRNQNPLEDAGGDLQGRLWAQIPLTQSKGNSQRERGDRP
jgi:hypothetical protein